MYIGRFVILGKTQTGNWYLGYRVSSRSFPNRTLRALDDRAIVVPTADAAPTDNPYISYSCYRQHGSKLVVGNGSHVDPIIDKIKIGYPMRDALALSMLAMDYEHDDYNTPRITAGLDRDADQGFLSIVSDASLIVRALSTEPGTANLIATYELQVPTPIALSGESAQQVCDAIYNCEYELPVAVLVVLITPDGVEIATRSARA